jgi:hypothetical protein
MDADPPISISRGTVASDTCEDIHFQSGTLVYGEHTVNLTLQSYDINFFTFSEAKVKGDRAVTVTSTPTRPPHLSREYAKCFSWYSLKALLSTLGGISKGKMTGIAVGAAVGGLAGRIDRHCDLLVPLPSPSTLKSEPRYRPRALVSGISCSGEAEASRRRHGCRFHIRRQQAFRC